MFADKELQILKRTEGEPRNEFPKRTSLLDSEGSVPPNSSSSEFVPPLAEDNSKNIIPVYCSILAAVVVGLLAYVAFKWYVCLPQVGNRCGSGTLQDPQALGGEPNALRTLIGKAK